MQPPLDPAANHELFLHIRVVVGVILALTIGKLLQGFTRYIEFPKKQHFWPVHAGWALWTLLTVIGFWWWEFELRHVNHWTFFNYVYVLLYASSYYLLSTLLFPESLEGYEDFKDYFLQRRLWIFGLIGAIHLLDVGDTLLKGPEHTAALGMSYPIQVILALTICAVGGYSRNVRVQAALVLLALIGQALYLILLFNVLP